MIRTRIHKHEYGLLFKHGDFHRLLEPGAHFVAGLFTGRSKVTIVNTLKTRFDHPLLDVLIQNDSLAERLLVIDLTDNQRAFVWKDGRLAYILGPGRHAFWNQPYALEHEVFDVGDSATFDHEKVEAVLAREEAASFFRVIHVPNHERLLLFREGQLIETVGPGRYVFWKQAAEITWQAVDLREQVADVAGQEIMTADKVTLRVNLLVTYRVNDPKKAVTVVSDYTQALYREAQLALRAAVGEQHLDKLLTSKETIGNEVRSAIAKRVAEFGIVINSVGLRDIILPGDMKTILNKVIEAQKQAEANLIRRREETAAARSQANTARLLAENPVLTRMKELEAIQEILAGTKTTFILGQGDLVRQVKNLAVRDAVEEKER